MNLNRKGFLKLTAGALSTAVLGRLAGELYSETSEPSHATGTGKGTRLGMVVDMTKCESECTKCITACHETHNVPDIGNKKEEIKWIWKEEYRDLFPETIRYLPEDRKDKPFLTLCNHCDEPPCVRVCPTQATFKREDGVVMMDFHRCIGCRFCMAGCPYGSRSFNFRDPEPYIAKVNPNFPHRTRGVVEKCNFCAERVDRGQLPACVEACPNKALTFGDLNDPKSEVRAIIAKTATQRRTADLGTEPSVHYIV